VTSKATGVVLGSLHQTKKSYAKLEIPRSNFQRIQRMRRKRGGRKKCIRLTSCRQKGALMKFYDVALAQDVHDKVLTYDFFRYSEFRNIPSCRLVPIPGVDEIKSTELLNSEYSCQPTWQQK
jgi:hypothetical protein